MSNAEIILGAVGVILESAVRICGLVLLFCAIKARKDGNKETATWIMLWAILFSLSTVRW